MSEKSGIFSNTVPSKGQLQNSEFVTFTLRENSRHRLLFVGNSITRHGIMESIGWTRDCGMAASSIESDYVHIVVRELERCRGAVDFCIAQAAEWERAYRKDEEILSEYSAAAEFAADTVIIRIGENTDRAELDIADYTEHFETMVKYFSAKAKKVIITSLFWRYDPIDDAIKAVCERNPEYIYVRINDLGDRDECKALGEYEHSGVAAHPGDYGMRKIAEAILNVI